MVLRVMPIGVPYPVTAVHLENPSGPLAGSAAESLALLNPMLPVPRLMPVSSGQAWHPLAGGIP